jgi:hypothetical protein
VPERCVTAGIEERGQASLLECARRTAQAQHPGDRRSSSPVRNACTIDDRVAPSAAS